MYFEAEMKGKKYKLEVIEGRHHWNVALQEEGKERELHKIPKAHFQNMDDAICFLFDNGSYMVDVVGKGIDYAVYTRGSFRSIKIFNDEMLLHESLKTGKLLGGMNQLNSGMPGKIVEVLVKDGDEVKADQPLLIMEAMKMENEIRSPREGKIKLVKVQKGQSVEAGATLISFES